MEQENLKQIFEQFNQFEILIIGDVMIDTYLFGDVNRISPEAPVPVVLCNKRQNRLGGAANVALNISSLGAKPILCSVIGNDERSGLFLDLLDENNMTKNGILTDNSRITTTKFRIISQGQHLLRVDEETENPLNEELQHTFTEHIKTIIAKGKVKAIIFEDYDKGVITPYIIKEIVQTANLHKIPTLVDPKKRNFLEYNDVTLFKPNFKELTEGLKIELKKEDIEGIKKASVTLLKKLKSKYVLITLSEKGVLITDSHEFVHIPAEEREIIDVSGAGDTVISTVAVCLAAGLPAAEIARISNTAGGLVCEKVGVVPVNKKQLLNEISK